MWSVWWNGVRTTGSGSKRAFYNVSTKCLSSVRCRESNCAQRHHTLLHAPSRNPAFTGREDGTSPNDGSTIVKVGVNATNGSKDSKEVCFQVVPIVVYGVNGRAIPTFALLDSASQVSLIQDDLAKELGLKGVQKTLTMRTLNSETVRESRVVSFSVKAANELDAERIHVKDAWTVATGTFGGISQCAHPHLEHTKGLNIQDVAPGQVQVLIGISTPRAHIQTEIRISKEHQPIAVHTALGWTLMGGTVQEQVEAKINFTVAQDRLLSLQIEQFWSTESLGVAYTDKSSLSIEDRRVLKQFLTTQPSWLTVTMKLGCYGEIVAQSYPTTILLHNSVFIHC